MFLNALYGKKSIFILKSKLVKQSKTVVKTPVT